MSPTVENSHIVPGNVNFWKFDGKVDFFNYWIKPVFVLLLLLSSSLLLFRTPLNWVSLTRPVHAILFRVPQSAAIFTLPRGTFTLQLLGSQVGRWLTVAIVQQSPHVGSF